MIIPVVLQRETISNDGSGAKRQEREIIMWLLIVPDGFW